MYIYICIYLYIYICEHIYIYIEIHLYIYIGVDGLTLTLNPAVKGLTGLTREACIGIGLGLGLTPRRADSAGKAKRHSSWKDDRFDVGGNSNKRQFATV